MGFRSAATTNRDERESRRAYGKSRLKFGIDFLDDALRGILEDDLLLIGAGSGVGKTQFCCNLAMINMLEGKKIHYIALEAGEFEIERRLKYPLVMERFFADPDRPKIDKVSYADWVLGDAIDELAEYEESADKFFDSAFRDLFLFYKQDSFGLAHLREAILSCSTDTSLVIVDHVHYFDFDDDNENRAMKDLAKAVRQLALGERKPIVLIAHLRKRDRGNDDLVPGLEEFHGSSDLYKIATKVITMSSGRPIGDGLYETFFRIPKNRLDGGVTRYAAREFFNQRTGGYEKGKYSLCWAEQKRSTNFGEIAREQYPKWARLCGGMLHPRHEGPIKNHAPGASPAQRMPYVD